MLKFALALFLFLGSTPVAAQWDPDWNLTARDSQLHVVAGAGVAVGARVILPKARTWQRLAVAFTIQLAYEIGQDATPHPRGRGFGIGPKDLLCGMLGAVLIEYTWKALR